MYGWRRELPAAMSNMECADAPQSLHHTRPTNTHGKSSQIHSIHIYSNNKHTLQQYNKTTIHLKILIQIFTRASISTNLYILQYIAATHNTYPQSLVLRRAQWNSAMSPPCNVQVGRYSWPSSRAIIGGAIFWAVSWSKSLLITVLASCNISECFRKAFFRPTFTFVLFCESVVPKKSNLTPF